ncbi:2-dehydro-3-deoxygalactonokinase [Sphingosinicella terrae]|uniref:2-dehydro-3-deoxygalactonokinase n=1 Tax=Sphingosinicella terrae TaxID=2172047 RepID=UPI000E0CDDED|nr:2-dehydro-3-deoxygalactonokinase [Sphingosinicella terrae]
MRGDYIAVDWGTTNRRAYAVDDSGRVTERFADEKGLLAVPREGFAAAAEDIRERLGDRPMLLAGMVGSNRGWREAPYVPCPAGLDQLAEALLWVEPERTAIVPGVCQSGAAGADVMRGEEVQILGAHAAGLLPADILVCHPGTHAKWILLRGGRLEAFRTMMTGEMFSLLSKHSILSEQLKGEVAADAGFRDGARQGLAGADLLATLFGIRARYLLGESQGSAASFASGLLIGSDVRAGLALARGGPVALVGRPDLAALYAAALAEAGLDSIRVDGAEAFLAGIHALKELI